MVFDTELKFIDVIPSKETVVPGTSLNVLGGVANPGGETTVRITLWGRAEGSWKALLSQKVFFGRKGTQTYIFYGSSGSISRRLLGNG